MELSRQAKGAFFNYDEYTEAISLMELGLTYSYRGMWKEAESKLSKSLELFVKLQVNKDCFSKIWTSRSHEEALLITERSGYVL